MNRVDISVLAGEKNLKRWRVYKFMTNSEGYAPLTVAIIGTGFGGLCMAIQLKKAGINSFMIFEKADKVGGTWRDNTYPGAACDVPSHLYSFSFEPKYDWTRKYSQQSEIFDYLQHCVDKYRLAPHIRFNTEIQEITFDEKTALWHFKTTNEEEFTTKILVSACGQLNRPAYPKIEGRESFAGMQFHSARWNHDYDLRGKKVAVIGTGASAIQFVPEVVKQAEHVILFQRTPPWVMAKYDRAYTSFEKTLFKDFPLLQTLHRLQIYLTHEIHYFGFQKGNPFNSLMQYLAHHNLETAIKDPKLRAILTPDYPIGCKRVLISNDYFPALAKENVAVLTDDVVEIKAEGVLSDKGDLYPVDTIIYGTGFQSTDFLAPMKITGRGGLDLNQVWHDGAEAYLGMTVSGFPNLFIMYGPNTNLGHNSIIYMLESQAQYIMSYMALLQEKNLAYLELKRERQSSYNKEIQSQLNQSIWNAGCTSWYKTASGKNTNNWPGLTFVYNYKTSKVDINDYHVAFNS